MIFVLFLKWSIVNIPFLGWGLANPNFRSKEIERNLSSTSSFQEPSETAQISKKLQGCGEYCASCDSFTCFSCILPDQMTINPRDTYKCICNTGTYCYDWNVCITCNSDDYYSHDPYCNSAGYGCLPCGDKCKSCSSHQSCSECIQPDRMHFINGLGNCDCNEGYTSYPNDNTQCVACPNLCQTCLSLTQCSTCQENAELGIGSLCKCKDGHYLGSSNKCIATCNYLCTSCSETDGNFCYGCVSNAEFKNNSCFCTENSYFDIQAQVCTCREVYTLAYSKCVTCKKYLSNAQVNSAFFSSSMSFIYITFGTDIDTTIDAACDKSLFDSSYEKMGKNPICTWIDSRTFRISLGSDFTQRSDEILLNGLHIVKSGADQCTVNYEPLIIKPQLVGNIYPNATLSGPSYFSLCGIDPLIFTVDLSTGFVGSAFSYLWSATSSPANPLVSSRVAQSKESTIYISQLWFDSNNPVTFLYTTITLTNILGLTSSFTMTTQIVKEDTLSVQFDQGSSMSIKASDKVTLKPRIVHMCSNSTEAINWTWTSRPLNSTNSPTQIYGSTSDKFKIYPGLLNAGMSYSFTAIASQVTNGITALGNASISIHVSESPLYLQLSRSSGDISPSIDFALSSENSFDPDSPSPSISYNFSCKNHENQSDCLDSQGKSLFASKNFSSIFLPSSRLVRGARWDITSKIYKGSRSESKEITIHVLDTNGGTSIEIPTDNLMVNSQQLNIFKAAVSASQGSELWWNQISGRGVRFSPNNLPTVSFPSGSFRQGETYIFQLYVMENNTLYRSILNITTNLGPVCRQSTSFVPDSGRALYDMFTVSIFGCYDRDDSNYPLLYTFQEEWNDLNYTLGYTSQNNKVNTYLFPGTNNLNSHVCDQLLTCSDYPLKIVIDPYDEKLWTNSSLAYAYWKSTIDTDNILSSITLFCSMSLLDWYIFNAMWSDLEKYTANNEINSNILSSIIDAAFALTLQKKLMSIGLYHDFFNFLGNILINNPALVPTAQDIKKIVLIGENYLLYGRNNNYKNQTYEEYIIKLDDFYHQWIAAATALDLVTQSSLDGSQNTEQTLIYNYKNFQSKWLSWNMNLGSSGFIKFPSSLSFDNADIMNFRVIYYNSSREDRFYTDIISLGFFNSGKYNNFSLSTHKEIKIFYATAQYPFTLEIPIHENISNNMTLNCFFYNETARNWASLYCNITKISNSTVTFTVNHLSIYKISYENKNIPAKNNKNNDEDKHNYAPIFILVGTIISPFILIPFLMLCDLILHKFIDWSKKSKNHKEVPTKIKDQDANGMQRGSESPETAYRSNFSIHSPQEDVENWTENSFAKHDNDVPEQEEISESNCKKFETVLEQLIEGHLVFGFLVLYRSNVARLLKLFTIMTVILLELFLEGLFFFIWEDTETLIAKSTQSLFIRYQAHYFLYTVYALLITFPIELLMLMTLCMDFTPRSFGFIFSIALGTILLAGSIVGICVLNHYLKRSWCGFWAISYLYGALIEIFGIQIAWMLFRYFFVYYLPKVQNKLK